MDISQLRLAAVTTLSLLIAVSQPALAEKEQSKERQMLAGPIGKSSSASARITLIIPPRQDQKAKQASAASKAPAKVSTSNKKQ